VAKKNDVLQAREALNNSVIVGAEMAWLLRDHCQIMVAFVGNPVYTFSSSSETANAAHRSRA
jgi:hypothetical protein